MPSPKRKSRRPLKPLREFLRHFGENLLDDAHDKRFYQKVVVSYCKCKLPQWHVRGTHDGDVLRCHEQYWCSLLKNNRGSCKLAKWCHFLIGNREANEQWNHWAVKLAACLIDPSHQLLPAEERYGIRFGDGIAFGPVHRRILFDSLKKYMGSHDMAVYIGEVGVPQILDVEHVAEADLLKKKALLVGVLDWWLEFCHNFLMQQHQESHRGYVTYGKAPKLRSRPASFRFGPYKRVSAPSRSWQESWRHGQNGEWIYMENA